MWSPARPFDVSWFQGGCQLLQLINREGERAWTLQSAAVTDYLAQLETAVREKRYKGIGELVANSTYSRSDKAAKYPADSALMRRLWTLSAKYDVPLSVHLDATPDSLEQMERVLASDRAGTWIWAHTGWLPVANPSLLRRLLQAHPNLFCELSGRESIRRIYRGDPIDDDRVLKPAWKALLGNLRLSRFPAWAAWAAIHLLYLAQHRGEAIRRWARGYLQGERGSRLILDAQ